jgi:metal-responsive CopG/Arc/MetJ family transcriptional regulator
MAMKVGKKKGSRAARSASRYRKVTYSLPETVARELDRRLARSERGRSRMVAEALAFYFAEQDRKALAAIYAEAARDEQFLADNETIREEFALLDREAEG